MSNVVHVYPLHDRCEHDLHSADCHCSPRVSFIYSLGVFRGILVIHNAYDARDVREQFDEFAREVESWQEALCR